MIKPLWPKGVEIPFLGITGPHNSGKSLFGLSINPKRTISYDLEASQGNHKSLGFKHIDFIDLLHDTFPKGYTSEQYYLFWLRHAMSVDDKKYDVIFIDPISTLEAGLTEHVKSRYNEYGFSAPEEFLKMQGVFWGKVKEKWEYDLTRIRAKCQTLAWTTHERLAYTDGRPTKKREPKGKATLMQLATLYLSLEKGTPETAGVPTATILKSKLSDSQYVESEDQNEYVSIDIQIRPYLPDRLPKATPQAIRQYIAGSFDYSKSKPEEQVTEPQLSDEDKLELKAQIASDERAAREAEQKAKEIEKELVTKAEESEVSIMRPRPRSPSQSPSKPKTKLTKEQADHLVPMDDIIGLFALSDKLGVREKLKTQVKKLHPEIKTDNLTTTVVRTYLSKEEYNKLYEALKRKEQNG